MSENTDTTDFGTTDEGQGDLKALREAANRSAKNKAEADALRRENAFLKAGINSEDPRLSYFVKGYEGELDPNSIRQAAIDAGFIAASNTPPAQQQAAAAQERVMAASAGATGEAASNDGILSGLDFAYQEKEVEGILDYARQIGYPIAE